MKKLFYLFSVVIGLMFISSVCQAATRTYDTSYGVMKLEFKGNFVSGTYTHQNGEVEGALEGNVLSGSWKQSNGKGACVFTFNSDFSRFDAKWSYAGETDWRGAWNGTQKVIEVREKLELPSPDSFKRFYNTEFGAMNLSFNGDSVTGSYTHQNGRVKGRLAGNVLTGTWTQSNGSGGFIFTFEDDYNSFEGKWNYKGEGTMRSGWSGRPK